MVLINCFLDVTVSGLLFLLALKCSFFSCYCSIHCVLAVNFFSLCNAIMYMYEVALHPCASSVEFLNPRVQFESSET